MGWIIFAVAFGSVAQGWGFVLPKTPQQNHEESVLMGLDLPDSVVLFYSGLSSHKSMGLDRQSSQASSMTSLFNQKKPHSHLFTASDPCFKGLSGSKTTLISLHSLLTV